VAYVGIKATIDFLGSMDFLIEKSQDPGWIGRIWNYVITPTPEINFMLIILVVGVAIWARFPNIRSHFANPPTHKISPLKIEFEGESNVVWDTERHPLFPATQVQRKFYGVWIFNSSDAAIDNVSVEIERIDTVPDKIDDIDTASPYLGLKCRFKLNREPRLKFSPGMRDRVPLISHVSSMGLIERIRVESMPSHTLLHEFKRHRIHLKVTGDTAVSVTERFMAWVGTDGVLIMARDHVMPTSSAS
jgi:hypothetical protein